MWKRKSKAVSFFAKMFSFFGKIISFFANIFFVIFFSDKNAFTNGDWSAVTTIDSTWFLTEKGKQIKLNFLNIFREKDGAKILEQNFDVFIWFSKLLFDKTHYCFARIFEIIPIMTERFGDFFKVNFENGFQQSIAV